MSSALTFLNGKLRLSKSTFRRARNESLGIQSGDGSMLAGEIRDAERFETVNVAKRIMKYWAAALTTSTSTNPFTPWFNRFAYGRGSKRI